MSPRDRPGLTGGAARWTTDAPAKVNLDLQMLGLRGDGYHLLSTVLQSVALADRLTLEWTGEPFTLTCDTPGVPTDASNLAWRGAAAMATALDRPLDGWRLHLRKRIPAEAGLGGGSADAAAAARLVAAAAGEPLTPERLADVIGPLGADVAFFAWGGTMRGEGIGDELVALPDVAPARVVIVRPPFGVSTRAAYAWFDADAAALGSGASAVRAASGPRLSGSAEWAGYVNDLEGPVGRRHPEIAAIVARLRAAGASLAAMSGSGSACFGVFRPDLDLSAVTSDWPAGTRVWDTYFLSRDAYTGSTGCVRLTA